MIILTRVNKNYNYHYNDEKLIYLIIKYRNFIFYDYDYYYEYKKYKDYYIKYRYYEHILLSIRYFNYYGVYHREDGPSRICYHENGEICIEEYFLNDKQYSYEDYLLKINKLVYGSYI